MSVWKPFGGKPHGFDEGFGAAKGVTYPGGTSATPTPYRPPTPGGDFVIPPGSPPVPDRKNYPQGPIGDMQFQEAYYGWTEIIYALGGGAPDDDAGAGRGATGPTPEQLAIERSKVHAQNMATFLDATIADLDAEISADRLNLDQAQAEFDRRMDALAEGGKQMEGMWKWTSQPGAETIHTGLREKLGMEPWKSAAIPFDPYAMAWDIVEQTPEIVQTQPDFDPLQQALDLAGQFV